MAYKYKHLIPQNTAPKGAKSIGVYDGNGKKVCTIPLGRLAQPTKEKLYSFGLISDIHLSYWQAYPRERLAKILEYFKDNTDFCCYCGDATDFGFWRPIDETQGTSYYYPDTFNEFRSLCQAYGKPVYGNCGNHESYNGYNISGTYTDTYGADPTLVVNNLEKLQEYTGNGLNFTVSYGNDLFIFLGQPQGNRPMTDTALQDLYTTLEANRSKRCFIFVHPPIGVGNPSNSYDTYKIFNNWGKVTEFKNLLKTYTNVILFHGHTHTTFESQELDSEINYSTKDGFKSVHVPSTATGRMPADMVNGTLTAKDSVYSQGFIVDVYDDCIVLNGMDFINSKPIPLGTYKIDTTLQPIAANTFTDSTGTIAT